jgi:TolB-like protein
MMRPTIRALLFLPALARHDVSAQDTQRDTRPTVAVMYFNNSSILQHADYEPLRVGIADLLINELHANPAIRVVERDQLQKLLEEQNIPTDRVDPETAVRVGKILGAHHMVVGGFVIDTKGELRLAARAVNVETSQIEHVETVSGKADDFLDVISTLANQMNRGMKLPDLPGPARRQQPEKAPAGKWRSLITYSRAMLAEDRKQPKEAATLYREFLGSTPVTYAVDERKKAEDRLKEIERGS